MQSTSTPSQTLLTDPLLSTKQLSKLLDTPRRTLEAWRFRGQGPNFLRVNSRLVRYRASDVESWLRQGV